MDDKQVVVTKKEDFDAVLEIIQGKIEANKVDLTGYAKVSDIEEAVNKALAKSDKEVAPAEEAAEVEESRTITKIGEFKLWGIPVAGALAGGFIAVFTSEVVDGFLANKGAFMQGGVKLGLAAVAGLFGHKIMGKTMAYAVALLLAYDGIRTLIPLDTWATSTASKLTGKVSSGGLGGQKAMRGAVDVNAQANAILAQRPYYMGLSGR